MSEDRTSAGSVVDDRFVLIRRLGQGGGATVWLAEDSEAGDEVALKLVHAHLRKQIRALERFAREATVLLELDHPNIARCHAFRMDSATPYIAMDYVAGESLKEEIGRRTTADRHFTTELLLRLFGELTSAVAYAHSKNVLHRDLSAANVLLDTTGDEMSARVVDFGVAKLMDADRSHATTLGRIIGTPASLAPEMAAGEEIDHRADQYSLGVLLFEMLTLRRAWVLDGAGGHQRAYDGPIPQIVENRPLGLFRRICSAPRPDVRMVRPELPTSIADVVKRAVAADAEERFDSVAELGEATRRALDGVVLAEVDATYIVERGRRRGSTIAPPAEPQEHTGVVPRRASSLVIAERDVSDEVSVVDPATAPTAENPLPDVPRPASVKTQTVEVVDPTSAPTDAVEVVSRPVGGAPKAIAVETVAPEEDPPLDPTPHDPTPHDTHPGLGRAPVAFEGPAPDTAAVFEDRTRTAVRPSPRRATPIVAAVVGVAVALVVIALFGVPFSEPPPTAAVEAPSAAAPEVKVMATPVPEAPPPIAPSRRTKRRRRARRRTVAPPPPPPPAQSAVAPKPPAKTGRLRKLLARVKSSPSDADALEALADGLVDAAKGLSDDGARKRIIRMVQTSRVMADVAGLERALSALERASS